MRSSRNFKIVFFSFKSFLLVSFLWVGASAAPIAGGANYIQEPQTLKNSTDFHVPNCDNFKNGVRVNTTDRLRKIRLKMMESNPEIAAYIVPSNDEHQSEEVSEYDQRRKYICGLTASEGTAVILQGSKAAVWTDSRYFLQAAEELDCNWYLMKAYLRDTPSIPNWLIKNLKRGSRVGSAGRFVSQSEWLQWQKALDKAGIQLVDTSSLVDEIWPSNERPLEPSGKIFVHNIKYAGRIWEDKLKDVREAMESNNVYGMILSTLEEVAWLFNLRGNDIPCVPVFKSYAYITMREVRLYTNLIKITPHVRNHLNVNNWSKGKVKVQLRNYEDIFNDIRKGAERIVISDEASYAIYDTISSDQRIVGETYTRRMMVRKNPVEIQGMKNAMLRDSVALIDFFAMLEEEVQSGKPWDELKASETVTTYRREQKLFHGNSFEPISSFGPNGANNHYTPTQATSRTIDTTNLYLLDSGGQYFDGTTDITRTFHFGTPTDFQKETYTRVLMGVIDLSSITFNEGTKGRYIDFIARRPLYDIGLNYNHGTGHGVGAFLNVHEFPPSISLVHDSGPFAPGMFFSIEPGFYADENFGIRLETLYYVVEANTKYNFNNLSYYKFEPVVFIPFEPKLIKVELLTEAQIKWLNDYNIKVKQTVGLELRRQKRPKGVQWVMDRTHEITSRK